MNSPVLDDAKRRFDGRSKVQPGLAGDKDVRRGNILVFAPHPDDETLGCGGAIALHVRRGDRVRIVVVTDGAAGYGHEEDPDYAETRREEARRAFAVLGVEEYHFLDFPDSRLEPSEELIDCIRRHLEAFVPAVVYCPSMREVHADHVATTTCVLACMEPVTEKVQIMEYEVAQPVDANLLIDISSVAAQKRAALECYGTQLIPQSILECGMGLNRFRSIYVDRPDVKYVEAFSCSAP